MTNPTRCNVSALGLILLHPRTTTIRREAINVKWSEGCERKWRRKPKDEQPAIVDVLNREITKADNIGPMKRQALMFLCSRVGSERLASKGLARTAWSRMVNWDLRQEMSQHKPLVWPLVHTITNWTLAGPDFWAHTACESRLTFFAIEFNRWGMPAIFIVMALFWSWLRWDEDCHLNDD